ncbi:GroES-like protein [Aspergillus cavernicola]|uniref:D-xylulose reductase n=1 Tax=Aspergillus cavernicola TaxID=176166 RepID=A0ABR4I032_9EURO
MTENVSSQSANYRCYPNQLNHTQANLSCLLCGPGKVRFEDRPIPSIEDPHDILVRISYVGVCGSDAHFWTHGGVIRMVSEEEPLVMGHEASGIVHSVGPSVTKVTPGDRVAIEPGFPCRRCKQCKAGKYNLCPSMEFAADPPRAHGTLARFFRAPEDFVYKVPDSVGLQEAVLVEPLAVAVHGARIAKITPGQNVLVQGSGTIGLLAAAVAKSFGAKGVFVADINPVKLDFAKEFVKECITFIPDTKSTPQEEAIQFKKDMNLEEEGVDVVLECTGVESSARTGIFASGAGATFVQIGLGRPDLSLPILAMCEKEIVLKTAWRYSPGDYEIALELLASGRISVSSLISSIVPFTDAAVAWERTKRGEGIKNLIEGVRD